MRFLQISDLHYCPEKDGRESRELRKALPKYILERGMHADELLITGDYRHARLQAGESYEEAAAKAVALILEIAKAAGITDPGHIHLIPGNHDRERSKCEDDSKRLERIKSSYSARSGNFEAEDVQFLKKQFVFFDKVCDCLYGDDNPWHTNSLHTYRVSHGTVFIYLNTAIMHNKDDDRGKLIIGNDDFGLILDEIEDKYPQYPIIVLAHHAPEFFEKSERKAVEQLLRPHKVLLYLCGDAHETWWRPVNDYIEITMGCLKSGDGIQATFLYGDTEEERYEASIWDGRFGATTGWGPYTQFNNSIPKKEVLPCELVREEQERLKNEVLLPWMKHSVSCRAVFPELFIHPLMTGRKIPGKLSYEELLQRYSDQNIAIVGDAGQGKSTLLRYIYLFQNENLEYLYLKASALRMDSGELSPYEKKVLALLMGSIKISEHKTILIDGMDETFSDATAALQGFLAKLESKPSNISVWFGWRSEHYYQRETLELQRFVKNIVSLEKWNEKMVEEYIRRYSIGVHAPEIAERFTSVCEGNEAIKNFSKTPFQLTMLLYLLENRQLPEDSLKRSENTVPPIYMLYSQFFRCWLQKERERGTSHMSSEEAIAELHRIAKELYYSEQCSVCCGDTAVTDLLVFSSADVKSSGKRTAVAFFHRSLCAFLFAHSIFTSIEKGGVALISALSNPLRNDITDFVRSAIDTVQSKEELRGLQENLMTTYEQATRPKRRLLDSEAKAYIAGLTGENRKYLRNELVYLITRLPSLAEGVADFVRRAYEREKDPYMKLDLAYGAVLTGPSEVALDYARSLVPGSEADCVNRSWTLAYFGDVQANPHEYRDNGLSSWEKARSARLKRFQSSKRKAVRFRLLDFPLMYCFYVSRKWKDVNQEDLTIIKNASIDDSLYTQEEKQFLEEQKHLLVSTYEKKLREGTSK